MANTVNDVMNVIASPDYGIKSIAGTNHEILAILQGTSNSNNNIHNIVDDVKNLIQQLVDVNTQKKPVEVRDKTPKINTKNIKDILDETKNIRRSIDNLTKAVLKQSVKGSTPTVAKLTDKASQKVAEAMIKNIEKQNSGGGFSTLIDSFKKLKEISLKDIIFGKLKINMISNIFKETKEKLNIEDKDFNNIIKLINAAPQMIKSLQNVSKSANKLIKNNVIEKLRILLIGENSLLTLSTLLKNNEKTFNKANKVTKDIKELASSLKSAIKEIALASTWTKLANKGVSSINKILDKLTFLSLKLIQNKNNIKEAKKSAKNISVITGNLLISSIFLSMLAVTGIPALIGSTLLLGIVSLNIFTFKMLNKSKKSILTGSILMALMGSSLILYGIALKKITDATKNVSWKQVAIIGASLLTLALATAALGIPAVAPFIALGSISLSILSIGLLIYSTALGKMTNATKDLKMKQVLIIGGSILSIGIPVASLGLLSIPITLGSITLGVMSYSLYTFAKSLKLVSNIGSTEKAVQQVLSAMKNVRDFFINNSLKLKVIRSAKRYSKIMKPFSKTANHLSKLKETGSVPSKLIYQVLDAMLTIGNYYKENKIKKETIKQAKNYLKMMKPFGKTLKFFDKLVELGSVPMKLVEQTLTTMSVIANYYKENKIKKETVKQAKNYLKMMKPFGKTLKYFNKLTELGSIPMKLVNQTLVTMSTIANYYKENPIDKKIVKQSKKYKKMLMSFGKTLKHFVKLKEIGTIPTIVIKSVITAMDDIAKFYDTVKLNDSSENKSKSIEKIVDNFANTTFNTQDKLTNIKAIDNTTIKTIVDAFKYITDYYSHTLFLASKDKVDNMNSSIEKFVIFTKILKDNLQEFTKNNFTSVEYAVKSLKQIVNFLKKDTLNNKQIEKAENNITTLKSLTSAMSDLTNIDSNNFSTINNTISNTLSGVNAVDLGKVKALTNMFNAFKGINKSENIISKFTESVKEFTETCKNLMDAMNYNTDAINNIDTINSNGSITNENIINNVIETGSNNNSKTNGVCITNVDEIARTIAEKINGALSVDVSDTQVQLLINGMGGNEWTISRY